MAVPTVHSLTPTHGPTRGRRLVQIVGSNFQLPPPPSVFVRGKAVAVKPSVRVLFGDVPSERVGVLTKGLLHVLTPAHDPGAVSLTIENIDQDGEVVPGESLVVPNAYTFERPNLNKRKEAESLLAFIVRTLLQEMKRQIVENVELTTAVDFDDSPGDAANIAALATLPGLVLAGPQLRENRLFSLNQIREDERPDLLEQTQLRPGYTVDLVFTVIGVDDSSQRHLNLLQETIGFFHQNRTLNVRNPLAPEQAVEFEMLIEQPPSIVGSANNSNLRAFSGTVAVLGVTLDDEDMSTNAVFAVRDTYPRTSVVGGPGSFVQQYIPDDEDD